MDFYWNAYFNDDGVLQYCFNGNQYTWNDTIWPCPCNNWVMYNSGSCQYLFEQGENLPGWDSGSSDDTSVEEEEEDEIVYEEPEYEEVEYEETEDDQP